MEADRATNGADRRPVACRVVVGAVTVAVGLLALAACGGGGDDDLGRAAGGGIAGQQAGQSTATAEDLARVDLTPALLRRSDFPRPDEVEPILLAGDFGAVGRGQRIKICGEDLRAEVDGNRGRFSQFRVGPYAVTQTVTALPAAGASALGQRFAALAGDCTEPWTQPDPNGGSITRRILGGFPIPDLGTDAAAFLVRGENQLGEDDSVLLMAVDGTYVSTLTVTGPVGDRFQIVRPLELALGERLASLPEPGGPPA